MTTRPVPYPARGLGRAVAAIALGSAAAAAVPSAASADTIRLRMGSGHPVGLLAYTATAADFFAPELKRRVEAETDHTIEIQELHAGQVAKVTEVLEAVETGLLDIGFVSTIFEPSKLFLQTYTLFVPFGTPDAVMLTEAARAVEEAFPELTDVFETEYNQKYLGGACVSNYGLGTNFAWSDFADLEGHKIAGAGVNLDWIAGATPVASNLNEAYQSIQSGVYEGYISASPWWHTFKLNEVAPYYTKTDFGTQWISAVTINLDTWKKLPPDVQEILIELGKEWGDVTAERCAQNDAQGLAKLEELGVTVTEIDPAAKAAWAEAIGDFPARMAKEADDKGLKGTEVLTFYIEKLKELGHEFPHDYQIE